MGRKVAILIEDHYQVLEAWYPYLRLREEGIDTVFVGTEEKKNIRVKRVTLQSKSYQLKK